MAGRRSPVWPHTSLLRRGDRLPSQLEAGRAQAGDGTLASRPGSQTDHRELLVTKLIDQFGGGQPVGRWRVCPGRWPGAGLHLSRPGQSSPDLGPAALVM